MNIMIEKITSYLMTGVRVRDQPLGRTKPLRKDNSMMGFEIVKNRILMRFTLMAKRTKLRLFDSCYWDRGVHWTIIQFDTVVLSSSNFNNYDAKGLVLFKKSKYTNDYQLYGRELNGRL